MTDHGHRGTPYHDHNCGYGDGSPAFVAGSAYGLRTFNLDQQGWLRGVTYPQRWAAGENIARCLVTRVRTTSIPHGELFARRSQYPAFTSGLGFKLDDADTIDVMPDWQLDPCEGMDPACSCGFYAYHGGRNSSRGYGSGEGYVHGIVQAYGKVVVGPFGFRAEKARVVALVVPNAERVDEIAADHLAIMERGIEKAQDVRRRLISMAARFSRHWLLAHTWQGALRGNALLIRELEKRRDARLERIPYVARVRRLRENYPDACVYEDIPTMLADFQLEDLSYLVPKDDEAATS